MEEKLLKISDVKNYTGIGTTTLYGLIYVGEFPKQLKSGRTSSWKYSDVQNWIKSWLEKSDDERTAIMDKARGYGQKKKQKTD